MGIIESLNDQTINKISAGEVIERPASALKELLENSSDSGADYIEIEFEAGGKKLLQVKDNGSGISKEDLPQALKRHATSKLKAIEDLDVIATFGFRGEALASLAAVSKLTLRSTPKGTQNGAEISSQGSEEFKVKPAPPLNGTQVRVEDLFFNVPARQKFLKSDAGETMALKRVVKAFALSHPHISISVKQAQKNVFFWSKTDFFERCHQVLEVKKGSAKHLCDDKGAYKLEAFLGLPQLSQPTSQGIWLFVNGRFIQDRTIQQAIFEGYRNLLMDHQFPVCVLFLKLAGTEVDVNVHPAKAQVKFREASQIFKWVSYQIAECLKDQLPAAVLNFEAEAPQTQSYRPPEFQPELIRDTVVQYNQKKWDETLPLGVATPAASESQQTHELKPLPSQGHWSRLHVIGQLAHTYLVTQDEGRLVLIDQHAAHERVLFEGLREAVFEKKKGLERQQSLLEEVIELPEAVVDGLSEGAGRKTLEDLGFEVIRRGPTFLNVSTRPVFLADTPLKPLFERLGEQILDVGRDTAIKDYIGELLATMSCHGAIRAGKALSHPEMKALLEQMDLFPTSSFCPHGRPVSVVLSLDAIDRLFKRIV